MEELPPDQKPEGDNVQWISGYWAWDDNTSDFLWVSGTYRAVPPGRQWVPGYWNQTGDGWQRVAGFWGDQASTNIELLPPPPDPLEEGITAAPAQESTFQPGCWIFQGNQYVWRSGFWTPNQDGWMWTADSYVWTPGGYICVDGYWDYPFANRGLLFAPVLIDRRYWNRPGWSYQPSYVVTDNFLLSSLFVRPDHYYFGDYYDPRYAAMGFVPWYLHHYSRVADPAFSYYQWHNRATPMWTHDMQSLYSARRENAAIRPPRTLAQQTRTMPSTANTASQFAKITRGPALAPLAKVDHVKLQPLSQAQQVREKQTTVQFRELGTQRGIQEAQVGKRIQPAAQPGQALKSVKMPLPTTRPAPIMRPEGAAAPPARPVTQNPEPRPLIPPAKPAPPPHANAAPGGPTGPPNKHKY